MNRQLIPLNAPVEFVKIKIKLETPNSALKGLTSSTTRLIASLASAASLRTASIGQPREVREKDQQNHTKSNRTRLKKNRTYMAEPNNTVHNLSKSRGSAKNPGEPILLVPAKQELLFSRNMLRVTNLAHKIENRLWPKKIYDNTER